MPTPHYSWREIDDIPTKDFRIHPRDPDVLLPLRRNWRRLAHVDYRHPDCICLITVCVKADLEISAAAHAATAARDQLIALLSKHRFRLDAYTFMPDHAHLVLSPGTSGLSIGRIIGAWKSLTARHLWSLGYTGSPWQRDYDDRVLRWDETSGEQYGRMIAYVLNNPVRKGLVGNWRDYPFTGCFVKLPGL